MSTRVFKKNNVGRSVAGLFLFASLLFCASCNRDELSSVNAGEESGELIPVKVSVGGINGFSNSEQPVTRANAEPQNIAIPFNDDYKLQVKIQPSESAPQTRAAATPLKDGVKFRVLAYLQGIGVDKFKAYADYEVQAGGTVLNLLDGSLDLPSGTYQFVCYSYNTSDALPAFDGNAELEVTDISSGTDFLRTVVTQKVEGGGSGVTLNINFDHFCSSLNVKVDASKMRKNITDCSATLSGLTESTASWDVSTATLNVHSGDIPNNLSFTWDSPSESVIESDARIVMPVTNANLTLEFPSITIGENTYTDKSVSLPGVRLVQGTSYTCTVNFVPNAVDLNSNDSTANCYIVLESNTQYSFDATIRGNGAEDVPGISYATLPELATATEARVLWQTGGPTAVIESVSLQNGRVFFTTGNAIEGNAVIGIFATNSPNSECLWSWHIWRLNGSAPGTVLGAKDPAGSGGSSIVVMMDRNLGAYNNTEGDVRSIGLYYQWGRKDPFPGAADFNSKEPNNIYGSYNNEGKTGQWSGDYMIPVKANGATEAWAVRYPTVFVTNSSDWMTIKNDNLWGNPWAGGINGGYNIGEGTKSIYDPCPVGYRVPPSDTWDRQTNIKGTVRNNGMVLDRFSTILWFPATGLRGSGTAQLGLNYIGYYWSTSRSNMNATWVYNMNFFVNYATVSTHDSSHRANGMAVRCVAE